MNWRLKAAVLWALSAIPGEARLHYWLQRHVTRRLPRPASTLASVTAYADDVIEAFSRHSSVGPQAATFVEFGAGWDLAHPLALSRDAGRVIAVDLRPLAKLDLVRAASRHITGRDAATWDDLPITYRAPADMRASGLADASVDCVVSIATLEHVSPADIAAIFREASRILKPGGLLISIIDYTDHYWRWGSGRFGFLRYADWHWRLYNPSRNYVNRLRHSDFIALKTGAGFDIVESRTTPGAPEPITLAPRFRRYVPEDLFTAGALIVARKP